MTALHRCMSDGEPSSRYAAPHPARIAEAVRRADVNPILKRPSTIRATHFAARFHKLRNPSTRSPQFYRFIGENCRGRLCFRIHGNGDDWALSHRARDSVRPATVAARPVRVVRFRASRPERVRAAIARCRKPDVTERPADASRSPSMASGRADGRKKAVLRLKCRAQILPNTLDISAFSAERLSDRVMDCSWI